MSRKPIDGMFKTCKDLGMAILDQLRNATDAIGDDSDCVRQLAQWIITGTYRAAFKANPTEVIACTVSAIATLVKLATSKFHAHESGEIEGVSQFDSETVVDAGTVQAASELLAALECDCDDDDLLALKKNFNGRVSAGMFSLVLKMALAYLLKHLPDILDDLFDDSSKPS